MESDAEQQQQAREAAAAVAASAEGVFQVLEALTARSAGLSRAPGQDEQATLPVAVVLSLRSALHPALRPYREDPLLPLAGAYVSLDARTEGLLRFARLHGFGDDLDRRISPADRESLRRLGLADALIDDAYQKPPSGYVGEVRGALFLPAHGEAAVCTVRAAYCPTGTASGRLTAWPEPIPVRPVSESIAASARDALSVALRLLSACGDLAAPVYPAPVYFDVACADVEDAVLEATAGDSLGLPLSLAFLSALSGMAIPVDVAATGAVAGGGGGSSGGGPDAAVRSVSHVQDKARALLAADVTLVFAPPSSPGEEAVPGVVRVETVGAAARRISPRLAALLDSAATAFAGGSVPPVSGTGGVAFVATEIEGAARLWQDEPGAMREAASDYARLVAAALARHGGYVFKERVGDGEGFLAAFARREDACAAAVTAQRSLHRYPWPRETGPLPVRVAVHQGHADLFKGDYYGPTLGQLRRVLEAANGGQTLVTASARSQDAGGLTWSELGRHRLRDLVEPVELFQLSAPDLPHVFDPPRTLDSLRQNLPVQETPLLGRDAEVRMLAALLSGRSQRLITLLGPGGVGKTRLALQAAAEAVDVFPDGVFFVSVEEAEPTPQGMAAAIGDALRLGGGGGSAAGGGLPRDPVQGVLEALAGRRVLLVLDNFESVLPGGAPFVSKLLARAPEVVCLVTSRALLLLSAERRFDVTPLALPGPDADEEEIRTADAVALFCARARAARPDFDPRGDDELDLLADVCRRLDGLPLAMELAAARLRHLTLAELRERLDDAFSVLTTRLRDVPPRHRTLAGTLEWSYGLLDPEEQRMLRAVSVFAGGLSARAAEAVSGDPDAFDLLASLEDKSLVQCRAEDSRQARFHLLNLVDEFAALKLRETGEEDAARAAHAEWFLALARDRGSHTKTGDEVAAFDALEAEIDNLRAAYAFFRDRAGDEVPEFVAALAEFLRRRGYAYERSEWTLSAVRLIESGQASAPDSTLAHLYRARALLFRDAGDVVGAREEADRALEIGRRIDDAGVIAEALNTRGLVAVRRKDFEGAIKDFEDARRQFQVSDRPWSEASVLNNLGHAAYVMGDLALARSCFEEALSICRRADYQHSLAHALNGLGLIAQTAREYTEARALFSEYRSVCRRLKDSTAAAIGLLNLGDAVRESGDPVGALPLLVAAEESLSRLGHRHKAEATKYVESCVPFCGRTAVSDLRKEYTRRPLPYLLAIDSRAI